VNRTLEWNQPILVEWNHYISFHFVSEPNTPKIHMLIYTSVVTCERKISTTFYSKLTMICYKFYYIKLIS
jgi:hypothetical protein